MNREERQQALRRLHLYIVAYDPSQQDLAALQKAHRDLLSQIEVKFSRSSANQSYVFPRSAEIDEEPCGGADKLQLQRLAEGKLYETLSRPKIKLVKAKQEKRVKTEYYSNQNAVSSFIGQTNHYDQSAKLNDKAKELDLNRPLKDILNQTSNARHLPLTRDPSSCSKGKSKLNQLTRSYANLKSKLGFNWQSNNHEGRTCQLSFKEPNFQKSIPRPQVEASHQRGQQIWLREISKTKQTFFKQDKSFIKLK